MLSLEQIASFYPEHLRSFKRNLLREYLQYKILESIFTSKFARKMSFMGGTAIHIAHSSPRFSEDLDFDNLGLTKEQFKELAGGVQKRLALEGYRAETSHTFKSAYRAQIRIADILYENGLSRHKEEKMSIHLDTEPQHFVYEPQRLIINKFEVFTQINVVPADILLAQKIYAIFMRRRPMGRDFYDALFLFGMTKPNFGYLKYKLEIDDFAQLKTRLLHKCRSFDLGRLARDAAPFLFVPSDAKRILLFEEFVRNLPEK